MFHMMITFCVLTATIIALISRKIPMIAIGLGIPLILSVTGIISADTAYTEIGSTLSFLIIGALILGDAFFRVGLTELLGTKIIRYSHKLHSESVKLLIICLLAAVLSAFLSSLGVQVALMSIIITMAGALGISKTKSLLALGYSATIGGMWTMIGTTLTVAGKGIYESSIPGEVVGLFEISKLSVPVGLLLILLFCFGTSRFVPDRCAGEEEAVPEEQEQRNPRKTTRDQKIVLLTFVFFIVMIMLDGYVPLAPQMVTVVVAFILGILKISTISQMILCIRWDIILFIVGINQLSAAITSTGLSNVIGDLLLTMVGTSSNPFVIIGALALITAVLTQLMNNAGAFGVIAPFLPVIADTLEVPLLPLLMATMVAATCGFALPLSAPSYLMLAAEGKIRAKDFLCQGIPMTILSVILITLLTPSIWPL